MFCVVYITEKESDSTFIDRNNWHTVDKVDYVRVKAIALQAT